MNKNLIKWTAGILFLAVIIHACKKKDDTAAQFGSIDSTSLPMEQLDLEGLGLFRTDGENWIIAGNASSDYKTDYSMDTETGTGVLANVAGSGEGSDIRTVLEHGDIELKLEFMVPKGSNSGIYFQDRYELQILDSWRTEEPRLHDLGGIYERWDESLPEGERGYEGAAPLVNASLAPGLWQEFHVLFRAPRFDEQGNKTENARFEWVYLNGVLIQKDVELTGPTRGGAPGGEAAEAPLRIQGDHGPVAFRNIRYKTYSQAYSLTLGPLQYQIFDYTGASTPPLTAFDEMEPIAEGVTDSFNVAELSPKDEYYASRFTGEFEVPVTGVYFFQTGMYNGGNLYINGELLIENTGDVEYLVPGNTIHLEKGTHTLEVTHFQAVWMSYIHIDYEGPGIEKRPLAREVEEEAGNEDVLTIQPGTGGPERVGGFFSYEGVKRTHTLTIGHPAGIHFSFDLGRGSLLSFWRDPFADVTEMWQGRGHEQLLVPMNAAVESGSGVPLADRSNRESLAEAWPEHAPGISRYELDDNGMPSFISEWDGITVEDKITPDDTGTELVRRLTFRPDGNRNNKAARLAQGESVELLPNGMYRINGRYYLQIVSDGGEEPEIYGGDNFQALYIPVLRQPGHSEIQYQLIW